MTNDMQDLYTSLRSVGRIYRLSEDLGDLFALHIRAAREAGQSWASIARDAQVTPKTARKYASRQVGR